MQGWSFYPFWVVECLGGEVEACFSSPPSTNMEKETNDMSVQKGVINTLCDKTPY